MIQDIIITYAEIHVQYIATYINPRLNYSTYKLKELKTQTLQKRLEQFNVYFDLISYLGAYRVIVPHV